MGAFILRRLAGAVPLLLLVSMAVFGLLQLAPGGPTGAYLRRGAGLNDADLAALEAALGLNDPVPVQYLRWLGNVLRGDLGQAVIAPEPVLATILDRLPNTFYLMGAAWVVTLLLAIPIGVFSALKQYSPFDHLVSAFTFVGISIPTFWLGLILILVFYTTLSHPGTGEPLLPAGGMRTLGADFGFWGNLGDRALHLIMPVTMLAMGWIAWYSRFLRASMLETVNRDYVRTARAKGLAERAVVVRHAFRNAAIPLVTLMALDLPFLFTGSLFAEVVFSWPGMGRLFFQAADRRDYGVLMAVVMIAAVLIVLANLIADVVYGLLDPRITPQ